MATRWYTKDAQYVLPRLNPSWFEIDGIYIDGYLFENDVRVLNNILWVSVQPEHWSYTNHQITFAIPTYSGGHVTIVNRMFTWLPGQNHTQSAKIYTNGNPYGMGLNIISVLCSIILGGVDVTDLIYNASFIMEVTV